MFYLFQQILNVLKRFPNSYILPRLSHNCLGSVIFLIDKLRLSLIELPDISRRDLDQYARDLGQYARDLGQYARDLHQSSDFCNQYVGTSTI